MGFIQILFIDLFFRFQCQNKENNLTFLICNLICEENYNKEYYDKALKREYFKFIFNIN